MTNPDTNDDTGTIDVGPLARGLLGELRALVRRRGAAGEGGEGGDDEGTGQLRRAADLVARRRREGEAEVAALYRERADGMRDVLETRLRRVEAYAHRLRQTVPPEEGKYVLAGRLTDEASGTELPNVVVRVRGAADGEEHRSRTDALGYFRIELAGAAEGAEGAEGGRAGRLRIEALGEAGEPIARAGRAVRAETGRSDFVPIAAPGDRVPASLALGRTVAGAVEARVARLERAGRAAALGPAFACEAEAAPPPRGGGGGGGGGRRPAGGLAGGLRDALGDVGPVGGGRDTGGARRPAGPRLLDVRGIGRTYAARLEAEGVSELREVAAIGPARLARMLGIGEQHAATLVEEAQRLLRP